MGIFIHQLATQNQIMHESPALAQRHAFHGFLPDAGIVFFPRNRQGRNNELRVPFGNGGIRILFVVAWRPPFHSFFGNQFIRFAEKIGNIKIKQIIGHAQTMKTDDPVAGFEFCANPAYQIILRRHK